LTSRNSGLYATNPENKFMLYNITSINRSQQYKVAARQWISEINFFSTETAFLQNLLQGCIPLLSDKTFAEKRKMTVKRLIKLEADKNYSDHILTEQFEMLEHAARVRLPENEVELACKQMELEFLMGSLNEEYREVKRELFLLIESVFPEHKR
jgi:hypothetical protein